MSVPLTIYPYNEQNGTVKIEYDDEYFSNVSYNSATGEITFEYNTDKVLSFTYILLNGRKYELTYTYDQATSTLLNINGYDVPYPSNYKMTSATLVDSARNVDGIVVANVIREGVRKLELIWNYLSAENLKDLMSMLESDFKLVCVYYDTIIGDFVSKEFYSGDRVSLSAKQKLDSNGKIVGYQNVKISLVEV